MGIDFYINWGNLILIYAIYAISLNLLMGYAGQVSVAHAAFGAVGGYGAAYMSVHYATPFPAAVAIGVGAALVIGTLVSLPALQLSSEYLILLTLAVATIIIIILTSSETFGGLYGLLDIKQASLFGFSIVTPQDFLWLLLSLTALVFALCWWLGESPFGRVLRGIRDDETATRALGKNIVAYKVIVFGITSAMAGLAGAMLVYYNSLASPGQFNFDQGMAIIAMVILGGLGNFFGSLVGAFLIVASEPFLEHVVKIEVEKAPLVRLLAYGLALVVILGLRPQGLVPEGVSPLASLRRLARSRADGGPARLPVATEADDAIATPLAVHKPGDEVLVGAQAEPGDAVAMLAPTAVRRDPVPAANGRVAVEVRDLAKHFGGIRAVDGLDLELGAGRITGLIGPNGAGKTTVFNLLTGAIRPDRGTVILNERAITGMSPNRVVKEGMARSYQDVRIYPRLSVLDNVMLGVQHQPGEDVVQAVFMPWRALRGERQTREMALQHLEFVGMAARARERAGALGFGEQKLVALARLLATEAEVLLLDEPASGIDQVWVERMLGLIIRLRDRGRTICIVEHNLHIVERLADQIYFMEQGRITAAGTMQDLTSQERLLEAYFGTT
jgi:branched-chain amino acid transport system ATP-binding protein/branched-chain amino acid transport system permease protein